MVLETKFNNIKLTRKRFSTIWGGASLLTTILSCMEEIFHHQLFPGWDFILNLSETDFLIK